MSQNISTISGFKDINDIDLDKYIYVYNVIQNIGKKYNIKEIRTPTMEHSVLFNRALGQDTDVVNKEMYIFHDTQCLRPELTASICKYTINNNINYGRFMQFGSCFRHERPQKDRYREFTQISVEWFGNKNIINDLELLYFINDIFIELKIKYKLYINSIGSSTDRYEYINILKKYLSEHYHLLSDDNKHKFNNGNIWRILDSKDNMDIINNAPNIIEYINQDSKMRLFTIQQFLTNNNIQYELKSSLIRGLDYYKIAIYLLVVVVDMMV